MTNDYIMLIERYEQIPDLNMHYDTEVLQIIGLREDGTIEDVGKSEYYEVLFRRHDGRKWEEFTSFKYPHGVATNVREDYLEMFQSKRKRGRNNVTIMKLMSEELKGEN